MSVYWLYTFLALLKACITASLPGGYCRRKISGKRVKFCCNNSEEKDGKCIKCNVGFISIDGEPCKTCPYGTYDRKCYKKCVCTKNQRCNNVYGCIDIYHTSTETSKDGSSEIFKVTTVNMLITHSYSGFSELIENSTEDVCENDDYECQHPDDVDGIGHLQHNKSQNINILRRLQRMSMLQCVKECFMTSQCIAINYRKNWKLCDILDKLPDGENIQNESGSIYTQIASWPKSLAGGCSKITCKPGQKCEKQPNGGLGCIPVYCESPAPTTPNATCTETFGLYRNLGTGIQFKCNNGFTITGRPFQVCSENGEWKQLFCCIKNSLRPHDCGDIPVQCPSEVYKIYPTATSHLDVYCDMETAGGRWTVIQRRIDGSTDFYRGWSDYEQEFGRTDSEYWLGNKIIHSITSSGNYELYVHLKDFDGKTRYAQYSTFSVDDSLSNFMLHISGYTGNAGDSLIRHNNMMFITTDKDNNLWKKVNCADHRIRARWYDRCIRSNLNGKYGYRKIGQILWKSWKRGESMKSTKMMIKKTQEL